MRVRFTVLFMILLCFPMKVSFSQDNSSSNLLENGDFEGEFIELEGAEPRNVADRWAPWHIARAESSPSFANHDPNYDAETDRIRLDEEGSAQKYFTLFATHQGGIYQEIDSATSGATYRFSIYAHVWSSSFEDADVSEDPGAVVVRVGIDPTGGTDGASEDIIWSTAAAFFYDAYRQYAVISTAESSTITVFVESTVGEPRANNYIYLDDAVLEVASETTVEGTPTSETNTELGGDSATETPTPSETPSAAETSTATEAPTSTETPEPAQNNVRSPGTSGQEEKPTATPMPSPTETETETPTATATETSTPTATATLEPTATATEEDDEDANEGTTPITDEFPDTVVHVVVVGDTVSALALQYESSIDAINRANGLNAANLIYTGQRLIVPINLPDTTDAGATVIPATATATPTITPTLTPTATPTATPVTYQILPGDTLENIAQRFGTTVDLLAQQNSIANPHQIDVGQILVIPTAVPPTPTPTLVPTVEPTPVTTTDSYITYVVQAGDTLSQIAVDYNTTVAAIAQLNGITNPSTIFVGQRLRIPSADGTPVGQAGEQTEVDTTPTPQPTPTPLPTAVPITHVVQFGDTLYQIAARYGVSIVELAQLNGITNYDQLSVGQVLTIPG